MIDTEKSRGVDHAEIKWKREGARTHASGESKDGESVKGGLGPEEFRVERLVRQGEIRGKRCDHGEGCNQAGDFVRIVEQKDANEDERKIREINTGCYAFDGPSLLWALERIRPNNKQNEYYLTDCAAILREAGRRVVAAPRFDIVEAQGVNTRVQLADVERSIQARAQELLMLAGVTIVAPGMTYIDPRAQIGAETVIYPFTSIYGAASIGRNCRIGPHALVHGAVQIADNTIIPAFGAVS